MGHSVWASHSASKLSTMSSREALRREIVRQWGIVGAVKQAWGLSDLRRGRCMPSYDPSLRSG